jgi:hypothetical protein
MKNMKRSWILISLIALLLPLGAAASDRWLHVRVIEGGDDGEKVSVNVPLSMIESMLPLIEIDELDRGRLHIDMDEMHGIELGDLLAALRDAPDATFVTVESRDESVRVAKEDGYLLVHVDERGPGGEKVRVRLPLSVAEALVGDDPNELDLIAALNELAEYDGEDLVRVESDDELVRIWIDSSETGL